VRKQLPERLESGRVTTGEFATHSSQHADGIFHVMGPCGELLRIVSSRPRAGDPSEGWEHVSVSTRRRCPNWQEMCFVKNLFWDEEECAVQYHPPKADYVNNSRYVLHLFRHISTPFPMPPSIMVGVAALGELSKAECRAVLDVMKR